MLQPVVADGGRTLIVTPCTPTPIVGDRQLLGQLVVNLVENAMRHTPPGTRVEIRVDVTGARAVLTVADDGPGIPAGQRMLALRRFGRLDTSRHDSGQGLGLALVEAISRLHRGTIALEDAAPGLRVVVTLPMR
jgi:signal transduction histidine kinase